MLDEGGYLTSEPVAGKRVYTITDAGKELLAERSTSNATPGIGNVPSEYSELRNTFTDKDLDIYARGRLTFSWCWDGNIH